MEHGRIKMTLKLMHLSYCVFAALVGSMSVFAHHYRVASFLFGIATYSIMAAIMECLQELHNSEDTHKYINKTKGDKNT